MGSATPPTVDFETFTNTVNGASVDSSKDHRGVDPSTRKPLWRVPVADEHTLNHAVIAAKKAFPEWSQRSWKDRQDVLAQMNERFQLYREQMTQLMIKECGKPIQFAALEVQHSLDRLEYYSQVPEPQPRIVQDDDEVRLSVRYIPLGVVAAICPWNFPLVLAINKVTAALVTGNCIMVKPSPFTPYSILKFVEIVKDLLPPGVLQALNGDDKLGPMISLHPGIAKISFTGSIATGKKIMEAASKTLKRVTLELGGNDACIVCPDVDVDLIATEVAIGAFFNSGQLCMASKRIYVHQDIYSDFLEAMAKAVKSWKVGPAPTEGTMLGPVQNEMQYNIVKKIFADSVENGHKFALGGSIDEKSDGFVINPAIIDNPPDDSRVVSQEQFGPIVPLLSWSTESDLLARVNNTSTGLAGSIWSSDINKAQRIAEQVETGNMWINSYAKPLPQAYFSGHKESGIGGEYGEEGLKAYCNAQTIHLYKGAVGGKKVNGA